MFFLGGLKRYFIEGLYFFCELLFIFYGKERENIMWVILKFKIINVVNFKEMVIIRSGENFIKGKLKFYKLNLWDKLVNFVRNESFGSNYNISFFVERGLLLNNIF